MGKVLLVGGCRGMAGAAAMAADAAYRGGAGYVVAAAPGSIAPEITAVIPSAVLHLCGDAGREELRAEDAAGILEQAAKAQSLAVGPGIGTASGTGTLVAAVLAVVQLPAVVDADALNLLAARNPAGGPPADPLPEACVLTPHPGEAARLLGMESAAAVQSDRHGALAALVSRFASTVLLKGAGTLVGEPGRAAWQNGTGNPGMATAGSGDVLTGLIAAFLARGLGAWDAARLGAWLHGRAGDLAAEELGEDSLTAADLLRFLPQALKEHYRACSS